MPVSMRRNTLLPLEGLQPVLQHEQVVDGDVHAERQRALVLGARREVRREQDAIGLDAGNGLEHPLDLGQRYAIEADALRRQPCAGSPDADWP